MAVMTKADSKKFLAMDDRMIDVLNFLQTKGFVDAETHRKVLLGGYFRLVQHLEQHNVITGPQAKDALQNGFDSLIRSLSA